MDKLKNEAYQSGKKKRRSLSKTCKDKVLEQLKPTKLNDITLKSAKNDLAMELQNTDFEDYFELTDETEADDEAENQNNDSVGNPNNMEIANKNSDKFGEDVIAWRPGIDPIQEGEKLDYDSSAYDMLHLATLHWSCLSFDIIHDSLGYERRTFPHTVYVVAGTQADKIDRNSIFVMKWSQLHKTSNDDASESSDSEGNESDFEEAVLNYRTIHHIGTVNRIRACPQVPRLVATWADTGKVHMWDTNKLLNSLDNTESDNKTRKMINPKFTCNSHDGEGYSMDWNPHSTGKFLSGDCQKNVFLWEPIDGGWDVSTSTFRGHNSSVEDLQFKKRGNGIDFLFASASVDGFIRIYDIREVNKVPVVEINAHEADVNVISWNPIQGDLLISGADDGCIKAWDTRMPEIPIVKFHWHKKAITSIDWHPTDEATFGASCYDDSISLWDLSVEAESVLPNQHKEKKSKVPDQLMFHHLGQSEITEMKFHPQIPGLIISTANDGFNAFKTCNI